MKTFRINGESQQQISIAKNSLQKINPPAGTHILYFPGDLFDEKEVKEIVEEIEEQFLVEVQAIRI